MKKHNLLKIIDNDILEKLFGFCYARTRDSNEAQLLCSDIIFELVKSSKTDGEISDPYAYIWRIARNIYANFSSNKKKYSETMYQGDSENIFPFIAAEDDTQSEEDDDDTEKLKAIYCRISFLTRAYREVMIGFYIDGLSTAEIALKQNTSETAIRQRLFSARNTLRKEVIIMNNVDINNKPVALQNLQFDIWGTGNPLWGDPRETCRKQFSKHIIWLCRKKAMSAKEISNELNVPTVYVEEELESLVYGKNGEYGFLKRLDNGKYIINFILLESDELKQLQEQYISETNSISNKLIDLLEKHKEEYLALPYLNKKFDFNLILWQQLKLFELSLYQKTNNELKKYFDNMQSPSRPYNSFGFIIDNSYNNIYGYGCDSIYAYNICGYSSVELRNSYDASNNVLKAKFHCGENISTNNSIQLAIRAINGLNIESLSDKEKEFAAKAIENGYLYKDGDMLYTKILVYKASDSDKIDGITYKIADEILDDLVKRIAEKVSLLLHKFIPEHLIGEWEYANMLAETPFVNIIINKLAENGLINLPENGIGAEGCWMIIKK